MNHNIAGPVRNVGVIERTDGHIVVNESTEHRATRSPGKLGGGEFCTDTNPYRSPMADTGPSSANRRPRALFALQLLMTLSFACLTIPNWQHAGDPVWQVAAGLGLCSLGTLLFRLGWPSTCLLAGIVGGFMLTPAVATSTTPNELMWQMVVHVVSGAAVGLSVGFMLDAAD